MIMNPPFVRNTGHEGKKKGVSHPMFAAFSTTKNEQKENGRSHETAHRGHKCARQRR